MIYVCVSLYLCLYLYLYLYASNAFILFGNTCFSKCHLWGITNRLHTRLLLVLPTPTVLMNLTCKENCQLSTPRCSHSFLTVFRNKHPKPDETCFGFPAPQGKPKHFYQSDVVQGNALKKRLSLTDLLFVCRRYLFIPLDFKTCPNGIIQAV